MHGGGLRVALSWRRRLVLPGNDDRLPTEQTPAVHDPAVPPLEGSPTAPVERVDGAHP